MTLISNFVPTNRSLHEETGIDLENICYYKDDTHYFVMTAKKNSLLRRGVLRQDFQDTNALLSPDNVNREELLRYAKDAAVWSTGLHQLQFALNHYGEADVAMFDFTSMYAAENACRAKRIYQAHDCVRPEAIDLNMTNHGRHSNGCNWCKCHSGQTFEKAEKPNQNGSTGSLPSSKLDLQSTGLLLTTLVGDSLLEPFWPTGSGAGRGFLSSMDAAWMCRQWALANCWQQPHDETAILRVLSERESVYRLLAQTTHENLSHNHNLDSISPASRYPNLNTLTILPAHVRHLLYEGERRTAVVRRSMSEKRLRRATIACPIGLISNEMDEEELQSSRLSTNGEEDERSSSSPEVIKRRFNHSEQNELHDELQQSLTSLQQSYQQLLEHERQLLMNGNSKDTEQLDPRPLPPIAVANERLNELMELGVSPSATKMACMEQSRCKELDAVIRQRKLRQERLDAQDRQRRSGPDWIESINGDHHSSDQQFIHHMEQQLRNKAAWLLNGDSDDHSLSSGNSYRDFSRRFHGPNNELPPHFSNRVKQLERKLCGISDSSDTPKDMSDKMMMSKGGSNGGGQGINVMMARHHLQQLLDPIKQEERFRAEVKRKAFMEKTYKFVGKLNKEDWNVKCFEDNDKKETGNWID